MTATLPAIIGKSNSKGYRHPSAAAYVAGCRCDACRHERYRQTKGYRLRVAASGPALIDTEPVRRHLDQLLNQGYSPTAIAAVAGADRATIANLAADKHPTTSRAAASRLLAVTGDRILDEAPDDIRVPAIGAHRRIRALQALGWSIAAIARHQPDVSQSQLEWAATHPTGTMSATTHRAVRQTYDELSMRLGPGRRTARWAKRTGQIPPLAWDDDDIDSPTATAQQPHDDYRESCEREELVASLTNRGKSAQVIAEILGCSPRTIVRVRQRIRSTAA